MNISQKKLAQNKKNDILKKFLNAQEYTKMLKKNAATLNEDNKNIGYSYDQIPTYVDIPNVEKYSSQMQCLVYQNCRLQSTQLIPSLNSMILKTQNFDKKSTKSKKQIYQKDLTQSSSQFPSVKMKKSSYSQIEKSYNTNSFQKTNQFEETFNQQSRKKKSSHSGILLYDSLNSFQNTNQFPEAFNQQNRKKKSNHSGIALYDSLSDMKTQSQFKPKNKKGFNHSNVHEYESQKLSHQQQNSLRNSEQIDNIQQQQHSPIKSSTKNISLITTQNCLKLFKKVEQLQSIIGLYQQAILKLKKLITNMQVKQKQHKITQILINSLNQELLQEKNINIALKQTIYQQDNKLKEFENVFIQSIEKIDNYYQKEMSKINSLEIQNKFLKSILRLELENNFQKINNSQNSNQVLQENDVIQQKMKISFNITQLKEKEKSKPFLV